MAFLQPRRFSEIWQADAEWPGTLEQQQIIRDTFKLEFGSDRHMLMKRLDQSANHVYQRSYLTVGFWPDDLWPPNLSAVAGVTGINFRASYASSVLADQADHELFHVADKHLMTPLKRLQFMELAGIDPNSNSWNQNVQETFADAGRDWWQGKGWKSLTPILLDSVSPV
jgi:hypothetical protein